MEDQIEATPGLEPRTSVTRLQFGPHATFALLGLTRFLLGSDLPGRASALTCLSYVACPRSAPVKTI